MNYKKEYKKYLSSSILDTANNKIASTSFITAFAIYLGLSNFAIGIYAVLDTITNIVQIFVAPLFSKELGYITFVNWRMTLLKKEDRTQFASTRKIYINTVVMIFSLIMGVILDKFTAMGGMQNLKKLVKHYVLYIQEKIICNNEYN